MAGSQAGLCTFLDGLFPFSAGKKGLYRFHYKVKAVGEKNLIIFIDSLPYSYVGRMRFLSKFKGRIRKVLPGFGYSINVKAEIFGGYVPDRVGYLNEWAYNPHAPLRKYRKLFRALRKVRKIYYLDRIVHKVLSKLLRLNLQTFLLNICRFFQKPVSRLIAMSSRCPRFFPK